MVVLDLFDMSHSQIYHCRFLSKHFFLECKNEGAGSQITDFIYTQN